MAVQVVVLDEYFLTITLLVSLGWQLLGFIITAVMRFDKLFDLFGGLNFVIIALMTMLLNRTYFVRQVVMTSLVVAWGTRLSLFLFWRILTTGEDARFDNARQNIAKLSVFWIGQLFWVWLVSLPVTLLNSTDRNFALNAADYVSWTLWAIGFVFEAWADVSKSVFKSKDENRGKFCDTDIWKLCRHPNYFGEILMWIAVFIGCASSFANSEWMYVSIVSPIFITTLILFVSGLPMLEESSDKKYGSQKEYVAYKRRTSNLLPFPPSLFERLPHWAKQVFFFEWPIYNKLELGEARQSLRNEGSA
ncbi:hypothetical protein FVE85_6735 [Porphyridium purpureum]|uniref:Steroid 5-alpha reductase C-terminal domain-containing protein n=1 Tax=Porphyridium purpureum TaxID=35688 RepID=A0A5J4Z7R1_PORPP|nr:hypothetical protein FVE85_6735 [Porphyridium purpureum]|eukprot:POR0298..scf295_1